MKYRILGKTNLNVSEIGFGAWAIGGNKYGNSYGPTDDRESLQALKLAIENGCNFIDTSDAYGNGHSEELIGSVTSEINRSKIIIATKVGVDFYSSVRKKDFSPEYISLALDKSLKRLRTDYVDIYQLQNPTLEMIKSGEIFQFMNQLKKEGKIRFIGVSVYDEAEAIAVSKHPEVDTVQIPYNLFDQELEDKFIKKLKNNDIGIISREPLANGLLSGKYREAFYFQPEDMRHSWPVSYINFRSRAVEALTNFLDKDFDSFTKLALKFVLKNKKIGTMIVGCKNSVQTENNLMVSDLRDLTTKEMKGLKELYLRHFDV